MDFVTVNSGWTGRVIDRRFPLREWLGGSDRSGAFLTELKNPGEPDAEPPKAVIRIILADHADAQAQLARWESVAKLSHPHVMKLIQTGQSQVGGADVVYCVSEYADEVLSDVLKERALTPDEVRQMLTPVLDALLYLHGKGFVHGHLKPSNVLVVNENLLLSGDDLEAVGEPRAHHRKLDVYDAPEAGRTMMTPAADVWSLGMTLVAALTQKPPEWDRARDLYQEKAPAVPKEVPEPFTRMARACLKLEPAERCTLADLAKAAAEPVPVAAKPPEAKTPAKPSTESPAERPTASPAASPRAVLSFDAAKSKSAEADAPQEREHKRGGTRQLAIIAIIVVIVILVGIYAWPHKQKPAENSQTATAPAQSASQTMRPKPRADVTESAATGAGTAASTGATTAAIPGGGLTEAGAAGSKVVERVMPQAPEEALHTIQGTVQTKIQLTVDASGNVTNASFASVGPSRYFANMALAAARQWKFKPGSAGTRVVEFDFTQGGVSAQVQ